MLSAFIVSKLVGSKPYGVAIMSDSVSKWLDEIGLGQYTAVFAENEIDWDLLPDLDQEFLTAIGVRVVGHQMRILKTAKTLAARTPDIASRGKTVTQELDRPSVSERGKTYAERRQLTVMFCDLVGSTALSESMDPELYRDLITEYRSAAAKAIKHYDGCIGNYMGDGLLVYFGYPQAHEDDAERAVRAALEIVEGVDGLPLIYDKPLQVRIGISTGLVIAGDIIGEDSSEEQAVLGDTPNLAARLQSRAEPGGILISESTLLLTQGLFEYSRLPAQRFSGFDSSMDVYQITGANQLQSRFAALHATVKVTPIVGRNEELQLVRSRWKLAHAGVGQVVLLSGEPGIGKSRLIEALIDEIVVDNQQLVRFHSSPYHTGSALWPFSVELEKSAGILVNEIADSRLARVESLFDQEQFSDRELACYLLDLLQIADTKNYPELEVDPTLRRGKTFEALLSRLSRMASYQSVLIVFEDVHWLDVTSVELLSLLIEQIQSSKAMLVVTFRPEFDSNWSDHTHVTQLTLTRLSRRAAFDVIEYVAGAKPLSELLMAEIFDRTDGVPLFLEELTRTVLDSGKLVAKGAKYDFELPLEQLGIPTTLQDSLMFRIDRLAQAKELAQYGSVIGREFSDELLSKISQYNADDMARLIRQLVASGLVFERLGSRGKTYVFKHALIQEAAYNSLLKKTRRQIHATVAELLAKNTSIEHGEPELLARHFCEAELYERSVEQWIMAGKLAARRSSLQEAHAHLQSAKRDLARMPYSIERDKLELDLSIELGTVLITLYGWSGVSVENVYLRAEELCSNIDIPEQTFRVKWNLWHLNSQILGRHLSLPQQYVNELNELSGKLTDSGLILQTHHASWTTFFNLPELKQCKDHTEAGRNIYNDKEHRDHKFIFAGHDPGTCSRNYGALSWQLLGFPDTALSRWQEGRALALKLNQPLSIVGTIFFGAMLHQFRQDVDTTLHLCEELKHYCDSKSIAPNFVSMAHVLAGWCQAKKGNASEGIEQIKRGITELQEIRIELRRPYYLALLAESYILSNRYSQARATLDEANQFVEDRGERFWEAEIVRLTGELALAEQLNLQIASQHFKQSQKIARDQQSLLLQLRAAVADAELFVRSDESSSTLNTVAELLELVTEGRDTVDIKRAQKLLDVEPIA